MVLWKNMSTFVSPGIQESRPYPGRRDDAGNTDNFLPDYNDWLLRTQGIVDGVTSNLKKVTDLPVLGEKSKWKRRLQEISKPLFWFTDKQNPLLLFRRCEFKFHQALEIFSELVGTQSGNEFKSNLPFEGNASFVGYYLKNIILPTMGHFFRNFDQKTPALRFVQERNLISNTDTDFNYKDTRPELDCLIGITEMRIIFDRFKILARNSTRTELHDFVNEHLNLLKRKYRNDLPLLKITFAFVIAGVITDVCRDVVNEVHEFSDVESQLNMKNRSIILLHAVNDLWAKKDQYFVVD
jgi:hypothetical protein